MSDHDDHELRSRLQWLSSQRLDDDRSYAEVLRRVRAAKRRRVTIASISLTGALILGLVANGIRSGTSRTITNPSVESSITDPARDQTTSTNTTALSASTSTTTTTIAATTTESAAPTTDTAIPQFGDTQPDVPAPMPSATPSAGGGTTASTTGNAKPKPTATTIAPNQPTQTSQATGTIEPTQSSEEPSTSEPPQTSATTEPETTPPTTTVSTHDETKLVSALHGNITVQLKDRDLNLLDHSAETGYDYRVDVDEDTHIRVRFQNGANTSLIDVVVVAGHISTTVTESSNGQFEAATSTPARDRTQTWDTQPPNRYDG